MVWVIPGDKILLSDAVEVLALLLNVLVQILPRPVAIRKIPHTINAVPAMCLVEMISSKKKRPAISVPMANDPAATGKARERGS